MASLPGESGLRNAGEIGLGELPCLAGGVAPILVDGRGLVDGSGEVERPGEAVRRGCTEAR